MIKNIFKGFMIGIAKIVPGVSGSMIAISFGVYERILKVIANVRQIRFKDLTFLGSLAFGILFGVCLFSKVVRWLLLEFYLPTMLLFSGLILGGLRNLWADVFLSDLPRHGGSRGLVNLMLGVKSFTFKMMILFILSFGVVFMPMLGFWFFDSGISISYGVLTYFILGFIEAFSSVIPGISGTAIYMSLGCYDMLLDFFGNMFDLNYFNFFIFFSLGLFVGTIGLAKAIVFLLERYKKITYVSILGFMCGSLFLMIFKAFSFATSVFDVCFGVILFFSGYILMKKMEDLVEKDGS